MTPAQFAELAKRRDAAFVSAGYAPYGRAHAQGIGLHGEVLCAELFGLPLNTEPGPDGGRDFTFTKRGRLVTIDVKTFRNPAHLLVQVERMGHCADILALCGYTEARGAWFVGWETRDILRLSDPRVFLADGPRNHWRRADQLRPLGALLELIASRDGAGAASVPNSPPPDEPGPGDSVWPEWPQWAEEPAL